jgi:hypothetical protein
MGRRHHRRYETPSNTAIVILVRNGLSPQSIACLALRFTLYETNLLVSVFGYFQLFFNFWAILAFKRFTSTTLRVFAFGFGGLFSFLHHLPLLLTVSPAPI